MVCTMQRAWSAIHSTRTHIQSRKCQLPNPMQKVVIFTQKTWKLNKCLMNARARVFPSLLIAWSRIYACTPAVQLEYIVVQHKISCSSLPFYPRKMFIITAPFTFIFHNLNCPSSFRHIAGHESCPNTSGWKDKKRTHTHTQMKTNEELNYMCIRSIGSGGRQKISTLY